MQSPLIKDKKKNKHGFIFCFRFGYGRIELKKNHMVLIKENSIKNRLYPQRQRKKKNWSVRQCQTEKKRKPECKTKKKIKEKK